jgi:hypothetical protein
MKYNISLSGRGCDCRIFKIKDEEYLYLKENDVENEKLHFEEICEYLKKDLLFEDFDDCVTGAYLDESWITVEDEIGNQVFDGEPIDSHLDNSEWISIDFEGKENYLALEDYSKGKFFTFNLESEIFEINKLSFIVKEVCEVRDIIIGVKYDGEDITDTMEFGDFWSKGFYYILSEKFKKD